MKEQLPTILWDAPRNYTKPEWYTEVKAALENDKNFNTIQTGASEFGKDINKLGRLALIADSLEQTATASLIRQKIKASLEPWLNGTYLAYDTTWGGVITFKSLNESSVVRSNAHYFNHLQDFGNMIYAIAAVVRKDISFYNQYKQRILALVRDVANPSSKDRFFPVTRQKDWYLGVSWSTGLDQFQDNRGVESASASIHGYYAIVLLAKAINYSNMYDFARLLAATEIRSAQTYFQIRDDSIYPKQFAKNGMVGVLWDTKVDFTTYSGNGLEYAQGNQMRPFSPITEVLLDYNFTIIDYKLYQTANATGQWLSYQIMDQAIIDPVAAWDKLNSTSIINWGSNSLTNALWWVATRPLQAVVLS